MPELEAKIQRWVDGVLDGKIVAGKLLIQAIQRHERDLKRTEPGLRFEPAASWKAITYITFLRHWEGPYAGERLILEPWQSWATWVLFGWLRLNDRGKWVRRFTRAYAEIARKNGKSTWAAAIANYCFMADGEEGAKVFSAATTREQASIVWRTSRAQLIKSPELRPIITFRQHILHHEPTLSMYRALSADSDSMDGLNPNCAIVDEIHEHPNRGVWDVLDTATAARAQPLILGITTAGTDRESICYELRRIATAAIDGSYDNDRWFCLVFGVDDGDDPLHDPTCWKKANPNLGISIDNDYIETQCRIAGQVPAKRNDVLRKHFNIWTQTNQLAVDMEAWNACSDFVDPDALAGSVCYGGLDLSLTKDFTAFSLVFPPQGDCPNYRILCRFWLPEDTIRDMSRQDREMHEKWIEQGLLEKCDGRVVDYELVRARIMEDASRYELREIAFDPHNANETATMLSHSGQNMVMFIQSFQNYNEPTRKFINLIETREIAHGGNGLLKWNVANFEVAANSNDYWKPIKPQTKKNVQIRRRIDGVVATIMALARCMVNPAGSVYDAGEIKTT